MKDMSVSIQKIKVGDEGTFRNLFDEFYQTLCLFALRFLKNDALAADVVQDVFVRFWEHHADFDNDLKVKAYLYTAVRHSCLNILRDNKEFVPAGDRLELFERESFFQDVLIERESYRIFYEAVDSLPPQTRRIIYLAIDGLKNSEIAAELNITESTVHRLKKIAYKKLKIILKDYYYLIFLLCARWN